MVVGRGYSIEQAAKRVCGPKERLSTRDEEYIGKRLRDALSVLAQAWHDGAKPAGGQSGIREVETMVAHASETGVRYSYGQS
jgi:hypothetical protein